MIRTLTEKKDRTPIFATLSRRISKKFQAVVLTLFFTTVSSHAYEALAKEAGMSQTQMKKIIKKVVKFETTNGSYTKLNRKSGAYGRYQIMPSTAKAYAKKLHIPYSKWKLPRNQDRIFQAILKDNIRSLKRNGLEINAFAIYGTHQQGAGGFNAIMKNKKLTKRLERNLRHNLPKKLSKISRKKLKHVWVKYWKKKFS